jgi:hypothetical protein
MKTKLSAPSEVSVAFIQGMADRMGVSFHKYGPLANNYPFPANAIENLKKRLSKYAEDGNTEWLMDVANFAMIEYMRPSHSEAHFRPTDSKESPGVKVDGEGFVHGRIADNGR